MAFDLDEGLVVDDSKFCSDFTGAVFSNPTVPGEVSESPMFKGKAFSGPGLVGEDSWRCTADRLFNFVNTSSASNLAD